jgi:hypothetical protein
MTVIVCNCDLISVEWKPSGGGHLWLVSLNVVSELLVWLVEAAKVCFALNEVFLFEFASLLQLLAAVPNFDRATVLGGKDLLGERCILQADVCVIRVRILDASAPLANTEAAAFGCWEPVERTELRNHPDLDKRLSTGGEDQSVVLRGSRDAVYRRLVTT